MSDYVIGIIFDSQLEKVALITDDESSEHKGKFGFVGGEILFNEDWYTSIARHVMGDLGIWIDQDIWVPAGGVVNKGSSVIVLAAASDQINKAEHLPEDRELMIAPLDDLPDNIIRNVPELIGQALSAIQYAQEQGNIRGEVL